MVGAHQKIDRIARRRASGYLANDKFPSIKDILHFEGKNGPDGIKLKSPTVDEYEHVIDPNDSSDRLLIDIINDHIHNLATALSEDNYERAAFESAWLAHAVVDGLTPPHHYKLDESQVNWLATNKTINAIKRDYLSGEPNKKLGFLEKWGSWGSGGVVPHVLFELGVASAITPGGKKGSEITSADIKRLKKYGFEAVYLDMVRNVYDMKLYKKFLEKGWTRGLAKKARDVLVPTMVRAVALAWCQADILAKGTGK